MKNFLVVINKIRSISKLTRKSNIIQNHALQLIRDDNSFKKKLLFNLDFFVRWNSTAKMIKRFKFLKKIAIALTHNPEEVQGIKDAQSKNLKKWALSSLEWDLVDILDKVLEKFLTATELISGQNYPTLAISHLVYISLKSHLQMATESNNEKILKKVLLGRLEYHMNSKLSKSQKDFTLVSFFLKTALLLSCKLKT